MSNMVTMQISWADKAEIGSAHIYSGQTYQHMLATYDHSQAKVLKCSIRNETAYLPLLIKDIGNGKKEAYSAYGYGGLIGDISISEQGIKILCNFLLTESIVAVFIRHSPFLDNRRSWPKIYTELNRITYVTRLKPHKTFDDYLKKIPQKLRWSVNYARRSGLEASFHRLIECPDNKLRLFYQLYSELMMQKQVSGYYSFSEDFFLNHSRSFGKQCELAEIVDPSSGRLLAATIFLHDESRWSHYHLSAAHPDGMKLQSMELLMASAIYRYGNQGQSSLHLGGGHSLDESDGLSRFKAKFSTEKLDFFCTKLICDNENYNKERERLPLKNPAMFLISDARNQ
jgi:Acetyltransferase (GNAT) domain